MNTLEINALKRQKVVTWLAKFGFSSRDLLSLMLNVKSLGQAAFFKSLVNEGITSERYVPGTKKRVVTLTAEGVTLARIFNPEMEVRTLRRFPLHTLIHGYSIQKFLTTQKGVTLFETEHELGKKKFFRRPDLLITNEAGVKIAVEVELTMKDVNRIYFNFGNHLLDWQQERFEHVIYLFTSASVCDKYETLYKKNPWPKFSSPDGNVMHISRAGSIEPHSAHSHGLMHFHKFEPYSL
ncbi:hypothetical protein [Scandinavium goeteborgense]|uniref:Protein involved in plasmid replication-relaxation n=1 Tax=Scandinavium goeteborgense TaxID=1851514 RepID=A0A4R6DUV0_SCAGO|nr:hypothetical protein [Scandinavium goeteborgense]TDN48078.1 hypothetical protein EC847_12829 [Scandinavium goeteborgense]